MFAFSSLPFESGEKMEFSFSFSLSLITFFEVYDEWFCCEMKSHSLTLTLTHPSPVSFSSRYILSLSLCHGRSSRSLSLSIFLLPLFTLPSSLQPMFFASFSLSLSLSFSYFLFLPLNNLVCLKDPQRQSFYIFPCVLLSITLV